MGTHPIFESDFDCLTDMKTVSSEGVVKKLKILPSKFREGSFYVILEIGDQRPLEVSGSASTQSVLKLADALYDGKTISFQRSEDPLKSTFMKSKRQKFRLFRLL